MKCIELSSSSSEHAAQEDEVVSADTAKTQVEACAMIIDHIMPIEANRSILGRHEQLGGHEMVSREEVTLAKQKQHDAAASFAFDMPQHQSHPLRQHHNGRTQSESFRARPHKELSTKSHDSHYQQGYGVWPGGKAIAWSAGPHWWQAPQTQPFPEQQQRAPERTGCPGSTWPEQDMAARGQHCSALQYGDTYCGSSRPWPPQCARPVHSDQESEESNIDRRDCPTLLSCR